MARLVGFGCSFMAGQGNYDVWDDQNKVCINGVSQFAWLNTLGKLLHIDVCNNAVPGSSNKEISYLIQNFDFEDDDIAIIAWTFRERSCIIGQPDQHGMHHHISVHDTDLIGRNWQQCYMGHQNTHFETTMAIRSAILFLEHHKIKHRHVFLSDFPHHDGEIIFDSSTVMPAPFDWYSGPVGADGRHPNQETYTTYAHTLYKWITLNDDSNFWK